MTKAVLAARRHQGLSALLAALLTSLFVLLVTPGVGRANSKPIDWTVVENYFGPFGNDVPLRQGQHDDGPEDPGFGRDHIIDAHGFVPPFIDIQQTIAVPAYCTTTVNRVVCDNPDIQLVVVFATQVDSRSGDGRPFGIITAFYYLPCLAANATAAAAPGCGVLTPPKVDAGPDVSGAEGAPVTLHGSVSAAEVQPELTWSYSVDTADPGTTCSFADPHAVVTTVTCSDDGRFTATLTADDGASDAVRDSTSIVLANRPPTVSLTGPAPWQVFRAGTAVTLTAAVSDAGGDALTCAVNWDDTATSTVTPAAGTCAGNHTFAHAGMYTIRLKVSDDDGGEATASVLVVVYDPDAGWVNMDGSALTPAGAVVDGPDAAEWTWAHLAARYYQPEGPPTGAAKTWVAGTSFRMDAEASLEWLVVTPDGKIAVKGTSTGADGTAYRFVFYGYDRSGDDAMRLVVWRAAAGAVPGAGTVYDNRPNAGYDIDEVDPLPMTSGAVQIHH
jgi:PKD domain-containing protein